MPTEQPTARHRTRIIGGSGSGHGWWQAWCDEPDCTWKGPTHPQRFGSRDEAEADALAHEETTAGRSED